MLFVFGGTFICTDADTAKRVTFHDAIRTRSVTLDGDVYDPQGSLSGGSAPSGNRTLIEVQALLEVETLVQSARRELSEIEREEVQSAKVREEWKRLKAELEIREHELKLLEEQVGGSNASRVRDKSVGCYEVVDMDMLDCRQCGRSTEEYSGAQGRRSGGEG